MELLGFPPGLVGWCGMTLPFEEMVECGAQRDAFTVATAFAEHQDS
jgi:hypothetical protein